MSPPQSLAENEELVAGRRPVEEAFVAHRPARRLLVVPQRRAALEKLVLHATNLRIPIVEVEGGSLTALAGFDGHQGIALVVEPRRFVGIDDILALAATRGEPPFILVLDSLEDPHNVGSLLRSAEGAGVHGVIFPTHRQAPLSPSAIKASAGAVEHLLLCPVDDLAGALGDLHGRGVRVAGAEGDAPMTARESDLRGPLAIVVGSEGQGLGPAVRRRCDLLMRIPMRGAIGSLNAAVAGSVLLFEAVAQRDDGPRSVTDAGQTGGVTDLPSPTDLTWATDLASAPAEAPATGAAPPKRARRAKVVADESSSPPRSATTAEGDAAGQGSDDTAPAPTATAAGATARAEGPDVGAERISKPKRAARAKAAVDGTRKAEAPKAAPKRASRRGTAPEAQAPERPPDPGGVDPAEDSDDDLLPG